MVEDVQWSNQNEVNVKAATPEEVIEWVQRMNMKPAPVNPLNDPDGRFAEFGDVGDIHYIAGTMGGHAEREFSVDLGDRLVLPMINVWEWALGDFDTLQEATRSWFEFVNPQNAYLKIDLNNDSTNEFEFNFALKNSSYFPKLNIGKDARPFYVESENDFTFYNPPNNINGIDQGSYDAYSVGYYAQIENLPEGTHKVEFGGSFKPKGMELIQVSVMDTITVADSTMAVEAAPLVDAASDYLL